LLEPLGALEQRAPAAATQTQPEAAAVIAFENVSVVAAGHQVLRDIDLNIGAGAHVAIVGASGAGKSSLVGLLLGWHRAASGRVLVDGVELDDARLDQLRPHIAWVDPAVQLWNRPLLENLRYGNDSVDVGDAVAAADLVSVINRLPDGLDTSLGEAGGLLSGGEGQRVRLGRALLRPGVRLAILDEPFRGLDFEQRHKLLARSREIWRDATLLAISHDIAEALTFERVLVLEDGRIIEDGDPRELARNPESRFHAMLEAENAIRAEFWNGAEWRHLSLHNGELTS
jgi:ATP-binding cassette subfamily B protein